MQVGYLEEISREVRLEHTENFKKEMQDTSFFLSAGKMPFTSKDM